MAQPGMILEQLRHAFFHPLQNRTRVLMFGGQLMALPYQLSIDPPWKCRYTLGWYRPGTCVPYWYYQVPLNAEAAAATAGVYTGGAFLFR